MESKKTVSKIIIILAAFCVVAAGFYFLGRKSETVTLVDVDVLITNAQVVTVDAKAEIYKQGWVAISNGKIYSMGQGQPPSNYVAKNTIDAKGMVAMPGFVNTHSHAAMTLLTGLGKGLALQSWLTAMSSYEQQLTSQDVYWGTMLAEDKMIKSGTTSFNDMYFFTGSAGQAVEDGGMRAVLRVPTTVANGQVSFDQNFVNTFSSSSLISFSVAPNPLLDYTPDELTQMSDYAIAHNYIVHIHFEEDAQARIDALAKYSLTPLDLITKAGRLRNKIVLAHGVDLNPDEISELSNYPDAGVSFNPLSEYNLQTPLTPVVAMLDQGITVAFGTDGEPSSNLDMFAQMKFAANGYLNCQRSDQYCTNGKTLDPEEILKMATINGAEILGLDSQIGSLEVGKDADIIIVKPGSGGDIYSALVYNTDGSDVADSVINGKVVMQDGHVLSLDETQVIQKAAEISAGLKGP